MQAPTTLLSPQTIEILACPCDHTGLRIHGDDLTCEHNHEFVFEKGIPVFTKAVRRELVPQNMSPCRHLDADSPVDSFVSDWLVNTNGNLYWRARGNLRRYPIPQGPFAQGKGRILVDVGCGWGRWSIAAARAGFRTIGLDVHIDALAAAYRVSRQLGCENDYLCAGVENLPLRTASVDVLFSYSVLQHLERAKVMAFLQEASRVLKPGGTCLVQLPNSSGLYNVLLQTKRFFREARPETFEMRYWSRKGIKDAIANAQLRDLRISADGFFSQNAQLMDLDLLPFLGKLVVLASHAGREAARIVPVLTWVADSLWVEARSPSSRTQTEEEMSSPGHTSSGSLLS